MAVGDSETSSLGFIHAVLLSAGNTIDLGTLPGGTQSQANDINDLGQIVGYASGLHGVSNGFLYIGGSMLALNSLVAPGSDIQSATAINNLGQIVANGCNASGQCGAFLLSPLDGTGVLLPGQSQSNPILPLPPVATVFRFFGVPTGLWFDPDTAYGYRYEMTSGSLFTDILDFPTGFAGSFSVSSPGCTIPTTFGPGMSVDFVSLCGGGVSSFNITGISPLVDPDDPAAFPIRLAFDTGIADFTMTPLSAPSGNTPEPASLVLFGLGLAGLGWSRRRK